MTAHDQHPPPQDTAAPPRNLRRIGVICVLAAVAIAAFGILQRRSHEAEVRQWTQEQRGPDGRGHHPASRRRQPAPGPARHSASLVRGADLRARQRLSEEVEFRLRRARQEGRRAGGDRNARSRRPARAPLRPSSTRQRGREGQRSGTSNSPQSTYQRWRDSPKGVVSVQEQESKQADYNSAHARLNSANAEVGVDQGEVDRLQALESFKNITAPFDGVVTARETDVGALINAGSGTGGGTGRSCFVSPTFT